MAKTVGDLVAEFLEAKGVSAAFGVVSIHNLPILDAIGRREKIDFVPSRGEAGAANMADAYARVNEGLGVFVTSTGTAAGNAAGGMVEALTASSPVLHLTGQIESEYVDKNLGYIHDAPAQLNMLSAVSKAAFQITSADEVQEVLERAVEIAMTPPRGPVSVEIPIDIQAAPVPTFEVKAGINEAVIKPNRKDVAYVADKLSNAKRPMLLLGGGSRKASDAALALAEMGVGIVTSTNGRAVVAEDHPMSLGAFNLTTHVQKLYRSCDLMIAVGTRLRSNETWTYKLEFPDELIRVDCDLEADGRAYANSRFVHADAALFLAELVDAMQGKLDTDEEFAADLRSAKQSSVDDLRSDLGPYTSIVDALQERMPPGANWVRDVTISNSMWGNRLLRIDAPNCGVHALGGGIGQGLPMAIGAACVDDHSKTVLLTGDGGLTLCLSEFATAAEIDADVTMIIMNDKGYGVIRNIQDVYYGGRKYYSDIKVPDFADIARAIGAPHAVATSIEEFSTHLDAALAVRGFAILEVDMTAIGPFKRGFAGPPQKD